MWQWIATTARYGAWFEPFLLFVTDDARICSRVVLLSLLAAKELCLRARQVIAAFDRDGAFAFFPGTWERTGLELPFPG